MTRRIWHSPPYLASSSTPRYSSVPVPVLSSGTRHRTWHTVQPQGTRMYLYLYLYYPLALATVPGLQFTPKVLVCTCTCTLLWHLKLCPVLLRHLLTSVPCPLSVCCGTLSSVSLVVVILCLSCGSSYFVSCGTSSFDNCGTFSFVSRGPLSFVSLLVRCSLSLVVRCPSSLVVFCPLVSFGIRCPLSLFGHLKLRKVT